MAGLVQRNGTYYITDRLSGRIMRHTLRTDSYQLGKSQEIISPERETSDGQSQKTVAGYCIHVYQGEKLHRMGVHRTRFTLRLEPDS